ncbi:uncharacterized protein N7498_007049 [Penicillium cinerascens]|uniref:Uncharacterized protein n=1 Tax=Penicillium cinerascens TaxID=70096 RepID=A0A9W9MF28_9EURO|nr:uncharacterized protein N7498_007049 [Penicillium cinerascens]KAJ5197932.1 hypothetical protein N7498_007049 [Penicillium cinerascens]
MNQQANHLYTLTQPMRIIYGKSKKDHLLSTADHSWCGHFATAGGLAVILALAFDPFTQNLIHYYPKLMPDSSQTAIVSRNSVYDALGAEYGMGGDPALKANFYNSVFNSDSSKPWSIPSYTCSTGNCTWDPISSLEMQAVCSNVTEYLNFQCHNVTDGVEWAGSRNCSIYLQYNSTMSQISATFIENSPLATAIVAGMSELAIIHEETPFGHFHIIAPDQLVEEDTIGSEFTSSTKWQAME